METDNWKFYVFLARWSWRRLIPTFSAVDVCDDDCYEFSTGRWYELQWMSIVFNLVVNCKPRQLRRAWTFPPMF